MSIRVSKPNTPPADDEVQLTGGPFDGFNVPKPKDRWARINVEDSNDQNLMHVYRPKRDGSRVYDGLSRVLFRVPSKGNN